jgi:hypothetical protein
MAAEEPVLSEAEGTSVSTAAERQPAQPGPDRDILIARSITSVHVPAAMAIPILRAPQTPILAAIVNGP